MGVDGGRTLNNEGVPLKYDKGLRNQKGEPRDHDGGIDNHDGTPLNYQEWFFFFHKAFDGWAIGPSPALSFFLAG